MSNYTAVFCAVNAKYVHASLAPWCLVSAVEQSGFCIDGHVVESTVQESTKTPQIVIEKIMKHNPQMVGFACYLWNIKATLQLAQQIKNQFPYIIIALGGPEVSYNAKDILKENSFVTYVLSGEGETSVPHLMNILAKGKTPKQGEVSGLCTNSFISEPCVIEKNIELPCPYTPQFLNQLNGRIAYLETSRGCPYSCAFCLSGRCGAPRLFNLEKSKQNIITLANSKTQTIKFIDRTFNANPKHANEILKFILENYGTKIPKGICFHFEIAADILKEETFNLLEKMPVGAVQLEIGMQSFSEKTLEAVRRKTNIEILKANIKRLVKMENMHIHIDLIAGLPYEDIKTFENSFNIGYELKAQMLQLGFLKLLHGSSMREEQKEFPCNFDVQPPYEIINTPWLNEEDLHLLHLCEDSLERIYNSGRFCLTADYALQALNLTPFEFYCQIGKAAKNAGLKTHHVDLDTYTSFLYAKLSNMKGINKNLLRDAMVRDRLATNPTGKLPKALHVQDKNLALAIKALAKNEKTAPLPNCKRGIALLYGANTVCFVDYIHKNAVTGRYFLQEICIDKLPL